MSGQRGHVFILGAGPGDPGLLTVAGQRAIEAADVIYYDALATPALLRLARPGAELCFVGKRSGHHAMAQSEIETRMVESALEGKTVVRLKGGDPFVFGRGGEEALRCQEAGIEFTVIPGITSAIAAPAYAGIPVTHRGLATSFMVVTGNEADEDEGASVDWYAAARADTLVILMGVANLARNMARLIAAGRSPTAPAALVRWGTRPDQEVLTGTVGSIARLAAEAGMASPVVTVVGAVVSLAEHIAWFRPGPLAGKRVVVTRARSQASELSARLRALGADVVEAPTIAIEIPTPNPDLRAALLSRPDWVVWTSANGVDASLGELAAAGRDARWFAGQRLAAVGDATGEAMGRHGLRPDFVPGHATSKALASELPDVDGRSVLLAVSALTDEALSESLRRRGARVTQVAAYENRAEVLTTEQRRSIAGANAVTFTSASTATNLLGAMGGEPVPDSVRLVSIGPQTSEAIRRSFGRLDAEAADPSLDALIAAVVEVLS